VRAAVAAQWLNVSDAGHDGVRFFSQSQLLGKRFMIIGNLIILGPECQFLVNALVFALHAARYMKNKAFLNVWTISKKVLKQKASRLALATYIR
jgi:hypothetical protein